MAEPWMFGPLMALATFGFGTLAMVDWQATLFYNSQPDPSRSGQYTNMPLSHFRNSQWLVITAQFAIIGLAIALMATQYANSTPYYRDNNWLIEVSLLLAAHITFFCYTCYIFFWMGRDAMSAEINPGTFDMSPSSKKEYTPVLSSGRRTMLIMHTIVWASYVIFSIVWLYTPGNAIGSGSWLSPLASMNQVMAFYACSGAVIAYGILMSTAVNTRHVAFRKIAGQMAQYGIEITGNIDYSKYREAQSKAAKESGLGIYSHFKVTGDLNHAIDDPLTPLLAHAQAIIQNDPAAAQTKKISEKDFRIRGLIDAEGKERLYIVSTNTAAALDKANYEVIGTMNVENNNTSTKGPVLEHVNGHKGISAMLAALPYNTNETAVYMKYPYDFGFHVMHYNVAGFGVGFGYWIYKPFRLVILFVGWGLLHDMILTRDATNGLLMWSGTFALALATSFWGECGQFWHLFVVFRLVYLMIMYENPNVVGNSNSYITDPTTWHSNTTIYYGNSTYTTIDNSTTVYTVGAFTVSWSIYTFLIYTAQFINAYLAFSANVPVRSSEGEKIFTRERTLQGDMKTPARQRRLTAPVM